MNSRVSKTLAIPLVSAALSLSTILSLAITGCTSHRKVVAAAPAPPPPELSQTPLYSPEISPNTPRLPTLPAPAQSAVVQQPTPPPQKPHHSTRKPKTTVSKAPTSTTETGSGSTPSAPAASTLSSAASNTPAEAPISSLPAAEKKPGVQQASTASADPSTASPIGELTAGSSADAAQTSHQTEDLIRNTRSGLSSLKRSLSSDEKKTSAEIVSFLDRAQQALQNSDVDGAYGLATKAKLLLDELTK